MKHRDIDIKHRSKTVTTKPMFLSTENLIELTDRKRSCDHIEWLSAHGFRFEISAAGRPKVLEDEVRSRLSNSRKSKTSKPNFELVK